MRTVLRKMRSLLRAKTSSEAHPFSASVVVALVCRLHRCFGMSLAERLTQASEAARLGADMSKLHGLLRELIEEDPGAVKAAIFRAYQAAGGDTERAASYLKIDEMELVSLIMKLRVHKLLAERWPNKF